MDENQQTNDEPAFDFANPTEALTLDKGAQILGDSLKDDEPKGRDREPNGRFKGAEKATEGQDDKVVELKTGKPPVAEEPVKAEAEDDDPEFEFEPEAEGQEPVRRKLSELVSAFEKAQTLEKEVEELRTRSSEVPAEYTAAVQEILPKSAAYAKGLELISKLFNPTPPNQNLANPNHPDYDPQAYWQQQQAFEQNKQAIEKIKAEHEALTKEQAQHQQAAMNAYLAREQQALYKAWPEAKSPEVAKKVHETLKSTYGFTEQEINGTTDHRMFLVIRDAMEFRASKAKEAEHVKVVRKLPKLVKGAARSSTDSKADVYKSDFGLHSIVPNRFMCHGGRAPGLHLDQ